MSFSAGKLVRVCIEIARFSALRYSASPECGSHPNLTAQPPSALRSQKEPGNIAAVGETSGL